jgi:SanA protein
MIIVAILLVVFCNLQVVLVSSRFLFDDLSAVPSCDAGLLLGTSRYIAGGDRNNYFDNRIDFAARLYHAGKIKYLIASGDNLNRNYDEPGTMKKALMEEGVPESAIMTDSAGLSTIDSVIRCSEVYGQSRFVVVSQRFHNERAVYIARQRGIEAYGFNAPDVNGYYSLKTRVREVFARVKAMLDVHVLNTRPAGVR